MFLMIQSGNTRDHANHMLLVSSDPIRKVLWKKIVSRDGQPRAAEIKLSQWTLIAGKLVRNLIHCFEEPCFSPFYHWFSCCFHRKRAQNHGFCIVLQLVSLYYKIGGVFTDSWLETMVSAMFCSYFHLILTLIWKNLHGLAKNHQKHMGFWID